MKQASIKDLSTKEIQEKLNDETTMLFKLKMNHAVSSIENPVKIRATRRTIARLKTELKKRESENVANK